MTRSAVMAAAPPGIDPFEHIVGLIEAAVAAASAIDPHAGGDYEKALDLYDKRIDVANRCMEVLLVDIEDAWRAQNGEPAEEPEEDGKDPKVRAAIETHRTAIKRLSPSQKEEFWDALRRVKRKPRRTKVERWHEALDELRDIQAECEAYVGDVPEGLQGEDLVELYRDIANIDLSQIEVAEF